MDLFANSTSAIFGTFVNVRIHKLYHFYQPTDANVKIYYTRILKEKIKQERRSQNMDLKNICQLYSIIMQFS